MAITPQDLPPNLASKIEVADNGCWHFTGHIKKDGYGLLKDRRVKKVRNAHVVAFEAIRGDVPKGYEIDHECHKLEECYGGRTCMHRRCVNPDHLAMVTKAKNASRAHRRTTHNPIAAQINRAKTHCSQGHEFTAANTYVWRNERICCQCRAQLQRRRYERRLALQGKIPLRPPREQVLRRGAKTSS